MSDGLILEGAIVEEFVLQQRAANLSAEAVVVVALILGVSSPDRGLIDRIQISVLEILISATVEGVRSAGDDDVELSASGVTEFRRELVGQQREFLNGIVRDIDQWSGYRLVVVVDTFNREVVVAGTLAADGRASAGSDTTAAAYAGGQERQIQDAQSVAPAVGRSWSSLVSNVCCNCAVVVSMAAAAIAVTSTLVEAPATANVNLAVAVRFTSTLKF